MYLDADMKGTRQIRNPEQPTTCNAVVSGASPHRFFSVRALLSVAMHRPAKR